MISVWTTWKAFVTTQYKVIAEENPNAMKNTIIGINHVIVVVIEFFSGIEAMDNHELINVNNAARIGMM